MDPAEKGKLYARLFRKAGTFLGKGEVERAVETLKEGEALASRLGDHGMARRFAQEVEKIRNPKPKLP